MFYEPKSGHGLPHNPFNAIIVPRPIGWVSTISEAGAHNLAPYSFFNGVAYEPPQVMLASTGGKPDQDLGKDSIANIFETGEFCINIVEYAMRDQMNATSAHFPKDVDEFEKAGLERVECETISCSRIGNAPASLECRLVERARLPGEANIVVFGEVTGVHFRDDCLVDGIFDVTRFQPLARLGYRDYTKVSERFSLDRPD